MFYEMCPLSPTFSFSLRDRQLTVGETQCSYIRVGRDHEMGGNIDHPPYCFPWDGVYGTEEGYVLPPRSVPEA